MAYKLLNIGNKVSSTRTNVTGVVKHQLPANDKKDARYIVTTTEGDSIESHNDLVLIQKE